MTDEIEVEKFKKLILDMYRGYPNWRYRGMVEEVVKTESDRKKLVDQNFLLEEDTDQGKHYSLGASALPLVSAWKTEQMTNTLKKLTWLVLIFGAAAVVISIAGLIMK